MLIGVALAACEEEGTVKVTGITFEGVEAVDEGRLRNAMATQSTGWLPWAESRYFDRERFEADLRRLEAFYADRGYPDARVSSIDVAFNDARDEVELTVTIEEGEPLVVEDVRFEGFLVLPEGRFEALREQVPIRAGQPRDVAQVQAGRDLAASELRDQGYAHAQVTVQQDEVPDARRTTVTYIATPGPLTYFGPVEVSGNSSVGEDVIRRQLTYRPGEVYRESLLTESQRRLYTVELFEFANIENVGPEGAPEVPTRVTVTEGKHRRINLGVGYGTEEKFRAESRWQHVNFFGGARTAGVHGKWSSLSRGVRLNFGEPYFFHPDLSFGIDAQRWFADEPAYRLLTTGGRATVTRRRSRRDPLTRAETTTSQSVAVIYERESFSIANEALEDLSFRDELIALGLDPRTGEGEGTLAAIAFDYNRNTTGNLLNARSGYVASFHLERAGSWLPGTFEYIEVSGEGRHYFTLGEWGVWANRVRMGSIDGSGDERTSVPFFKRYFLGGSSSLRGWGRFEVSPTSGSGLPIGGHSLFEASTELRFPLMGNLSAVAFVDAGNVWTNPWDFDIGDLRYSVGPGLRYGTPIGPVRFDIGYQLNPIEGLLVQGEPETRRWRMHFSIGQAF